MNLHPKHPSHKSARRWAVASAGALAIGALATAGVANAAAENRGGPPGGPRDGRGGVHGTLASVSGSTFTVTTPDNRTVTVSTTSATKITKSVTGAVSDIAVGDGIHVRGTSSGTDTIAAERIDDHGTPPADAPQPPADAPADGRAPRGDKPADAGHAAGIVASNENGTLKITRRDGTTVTVTTTSATVVTKNQTVALNALTIGEPVMAKGTTNSDGTVAATAVHQGTPGAGPGPGGGRPGGRGPR